MLLGFVKERGWVIIALALLSTVCSSVSDGPPDSNVGGNQDLALAIGLGLIEKGSYAEAVACYEKTLADTELPAKERARVFHILGHVLIFSGRIEEAIVSTQTAHDWAASGASAGRNGVLWRGIIDSEGYRSSAQPAVPR